jgi:hypothetical protein
MAELHARISEVFFRSRANPVAAALAGSDEPCIELTRDELGRGHFRQLHGHNLNN